MLPKCCYTSLWRSQQHGRDMVRCTINSKFIHRESILPEHLMCTRFLPNEYVKIWCFKVTIDLSWKAKAIWYVLKTNHLNLKDISRSNHIESVAFLVTI